jgi:hypothetical protein
LHCAFFLLLIIVMIYLILLKYLDLTLLYDMGIRVVNNDTQIRNSRRKQVAVLASVLTVALVGFMAFFSTLVAYGQSSTGAVFSRQSIMPQAKLIYNNQNYDMSPFVSVSNGQLSKIHFPTDAEDAPAAVPFNIKQGEMVGFKFSQKPLKIDAFAVDYEAQPAELYGLKRLGFNTFQLIGPQGAQTIEAQVLFADGHYASYDLSAYIGPPGTPARFDINNNTKSRSQTMTSPICGSEGKLDVMGVTASIQNKLTGNIPVNVLDNNLGTVWSPRGIDVLSFAKSLVKNPLNSIVNKNPWLQLDLGKQQLVCMLGIAFSNADKTIASFSIQTSTDGIHFKDVGSAQTSPIAPRGLLYWFPDLPESARFVRIANLGSITTGAPALDEIAAAGKNK